MKNVIILLLTVAILAGLFSCKEHTVNQEVQTPLVSVKTTTVEQGDIENTISLNGKTIYLKKNTIVAPIAGYVEKKYIKFGDNVQKNDVLFEIQTKENKALESNKSFKDNMGMIKVLASSDGIINDLNINETGGYVVEGNLLCSIIEVKDLLVQVNVPFEYNFLLKTGLRCNIFLSDNTSLEGVIHQILPVINEADQTQKVLIKPVTGRQLPENLNLMVHFLNAQHRHACLIPKEALMTNETQSEFWVMKIVSNSLAVNIPVVKGIENDSMVEIISSALDKNDLVISEGAYGLPDSTVVKIVN